MTNPRQPTATQRSKPRVPVAVWVTVLFVAAVLGFAWWDQSRTYPTPAVTSVGYAPQIGDVVFQSLPVNDLVAAIEGATHSPYSHCGIVAKDRGRWVVNEAIGPVKETPIEQWIARGRERKMAAFRFDAKFADQLPAFIQAARRYLGRPYDTRYRMDDDAIYCSELIYKAFEVATGEKLGRLAPLGDLDWRPYEQTIRKYEGGGLPLDRLMLTPRDLAQAEQLTEVFDNGP